MFSPYVYQSSITDHVICSPLQILFRTLLTVKKGKKNFIEKHILLFLFSLDFRIPSCVADGSLPPKNRGKNLNVGPSVRLSVCPSFQSLEPKRLAGAKTDRKLTPPPEIGWGPDRNQVFCIWVISCVINWSLYVINAGTGQTIGRSEKRMKQKSF